MAKNWRYPAEIQNYPKSGGQRVQIMLRNERCKYATAGKVDWSDVLLWRFAPTRSRKK